MIHLFHGDNIKASRDAYLAKKAELSDVATFRGNDIDLTVLTQALDGGGLFDEQKAVALEELFAKVKSKSAMQSVTSYVTTKNEHAILLWEPRVLTPTQLKLLSKASVQLFRLPQTLFTFLDGLKPNNASQLIALVNQVRKEVGDEVTFAMLFRQVRLLLALKENVTTDLTKRLAPWQKEKLMRQLRAFPGDTLQRVFLDLAQLDTDRKTGKSSLPLQAQIDFFLLRL